MRPRVVLSVLFILGCSITAHVAQSKSLPEYKIKIIENRKMPIRVLQAGELFNEEITLVNRGEHRLQAKQIFVKGCECKGKLEPLDLIPGDQTTFIHRPNTAGKKSGFQKDEFLLKTVDGKMVNVSGAYNYMVRSDVSISPQSIYLGSVEAGERYSRHVTVAINPRYEPNDVLVITGGQIEDAHVSVKRLMKSDKIHDINGNSPAVYEVLIEGQAPLELGIFSQDFRIRIQNLIGRDVTFEVHLEGNVHNGVKCKPRQLFLGTLRQKKETRSLLEFQYAKNKTLSIESVEGPSWFSINYNTSVNSPGIMQMAISISIDKCEKKSGIELIKVRGAIDGRNFEVDVPCVLLCRKG